MRAWPAACVLLLAAAVPRAPAWAEDLVATRPGLMCASADALARLTLPGGDSRTARPGASPADLALKASGGCLDIPRGVRVSVQSRRAQTSVVTYDPQDGRGARSFIVPNVDFEAAATGPCFQDGQTVTLTGQLGVASAYGPPGFGEDPAHDPRYRYLLLTLAAPVCVAGDPPVSERQLGLMQPDPSSPAFNRALVGARVAVTGMISPQDTANQPPRSLLLFDATLTPAR